MRKPVLLSPVQYGFSMARAGEAGRRKSNRKYSRTARAHSFMFMVFSFIFAVLYGYRPSGGKGKGGPEPAFASGENGEDPGGEARAEEGLGESPLSSS
jgi:hypothetical protein